MVTTLFMLTVPKSCSFTLVIIVNFYQNLLPVNVRKHV